MSFLPELRLQWLHSFLRSELAPWPGRFDAVLRFAVCITLAILGTFYLQMPMLEVAIIVIFFTVMENTVLTYIACVLVVIGTLFIAVLDNLFLGLTLDYPLIRVLFSSLVVFFGMYLLRAGPLIGIMGFLGALCVMFLQSNMPLLPNGEIMLRINLWSSITMLFAVGIVLVVCTLVRPDFPSRSLPREMLRQIRDITRALEDKTSGEKSLLLSADMVERDLTRLHRLLEFAAIEKKDIKRKKNWHLARVSTLDRLHMAAANISWLPSFEITPAMGEALRQTREACLHFGAALEKNEPFRLEAYPDVPEDDNTPLAAELREIRGALRALSDAADAEYPPFEGPKIPLLLPDATTNPTYVRFALKTVLATLLCLFFYKVTLWEGIHTCIITCIVVAQSSLGATAQKSLLRISGCVVGSIIALLVSVFIMPHIDDVTWYILICLAVLLPSAWVALGSPRSNYAGMQMAIAFALALMTKSGPDINLTEIRDRIIGILVGVVVSTVVHALIWPEKEESSLRKSMSALLRAAADMAESGRHENHLDRQTHLREAESNAWALLSKCREVRTKAVLEPALAPGDRDFAAQARQWLGDAQDLLFKLHARLAAERSLPPHVAAGLREQADALVSSASPAVLTLPSLNPLEDAPA